MRVESSCVYGISAFIKKQAPESSPTPSIMKVKVNSLSHVQLFVTPWTIAHQTPQSMEFSRQEYWSGWPFPSPGDLPSPGIEPRSLALQVDSLPSEPRGKPCCYHTTLQFSSSLRITTAQLASVIIHIGLVATYQLRL